MHTGPPCDQLQTSWYAPSSLPVDLQSSSLVARCFCQEPLPTLTHRLDRPLIRIKRKGRPFATCSICHSTPCEAPAEHARLKREADLKSPSKVTQTQQQPSPPPEARSSMSAAKRCRRHGADVYGFRKQRTLDSIRAITIRIASSPLRPAQRADPTCPARLRRKSLGLRRPRPRPIPPSARTAPRPVAIPAAWAGPMGSAPRPRRPR